MSLLRHFVIVLESKNGEERMDVHVLKHIIKRLGLDHGLRCINIREIADAHNGHPYRSRSGGEQ
jgi:hypothetical protein